MELDGTFEIGNRLRELFKDHTQGSIALEAKISDRTVRRALSGDAVDMTTVKKLAKAIKCSPEGLIEKKATVWVLSRGGEFTDLRHLSFKADLFEVFELIQADADRYNNAPECDALAVVVSESKKEISLSIQSTRSTFEVYWTLRPAMLMDSGFAYTNISGWDEFTWSDDKYDLFRRLSDDITVNGSELITKRVKPGWHVIFGKLSKFDDREFIGEQSFPDDASFRDSLNKYLKGVQVLKAEKTNDSGIRFESVNDDQLRQSIIIRRASLDQKGAVSQASLHSALANRIVAGLTNPGVARIDCLAGFSDYKAPFGPCAKSTAIY